MSRPLDSLLVVGGIEVPLYARLQWSQFYRSIGGASVLRMKSGTAKKQSHWRKIATTISAEGTIPPGLDALDYDSPFEMRCAQAQAETGTGLVYTLPAARRADTGFVPTAWARLDRLWAPAALALVGDVATITAVPGAVQYQVRWWPQITVYAEPPEMDRQMSAARTRWRLSAEEV